MSQPDGRRSPRVRALAFGAVVVLGFLLLYGGAMAFLRAASRGMALRREARAAADAFLDDLENGRIDAASAATTPNVRPIDEMLKVHPAFSASTGRTYESERVEAAPEGPRAEFRVRIASPREGLSVWLVLVRSGGRWKVDAITIPLPPMEGVRHAPPHEMVPRPADAPRLDGPGAGRRGR